MNRPRHWCRFLTPESGSFSDPRIASAFGCDNLIWACPPVPIFVELVPFSDTRIGVVFRRQNRVRCWSRQSDLGVSADHDFLINLAPQFCQWNVIAYSNAGMLPSPTLTQSTSPKSGSWVGRCPDRCAAYCFRCVWGSERVADCILSAFGSVSGPT